MDDEYVPCSGGFDARQILGRECVCRRNGREAGGVGDHAVSMYVPSCMTTYSYVHDFYSPSLHLPDFPRGVLSGPFVSRHCHG